MEHIPITIRINGAEFEGVVDPSRSPRTAAAFLAALPLTAHPVSWGGELYFGVKFHEDGEQATSGLAVGDMAFWPPGDVICIFFGKTPASAGEDPEPASPVNVIGRVYHAERIYELGPIGEVTIELR